GEDPIGVEVLLRLDAAHPLPGRDAYALALVLVLDGHLDRRAGRRLELRPVPYGVPFLRPGQQQRRLDVARVDVGRDDRLMLLGPLAGQELLELPLAQADRPVDHHPALLPLDLQGDILADLHPLGFALPRSEAAQEQGQGSDKGETAEAHGEFPGARNDESKTLPAIERYHHPLLGPRVARPRADDTVVRLLLDDVGAPAADARGDE